MADWEYLQLAMTVCINMVEIKPHINAQSLHQTQPKSLAKPENMTGVKNRSV
jgi:hypothetical protein